MTASLIDLHCHVLPGINDEPAGQAGSIAITRTQLADGSTESSPRRT